LQNERPIYVHKIVRCEVLSNPYSDIIPRATVKKKEKRHKKEEKSKGVK